APRGLPQVEIAFDIDASGILTATAKDKASGHSQSIKVEGSIGLSKEEVEKMKKEAEINAADDQKKRDLSEARNLADNLVYASENAIKDAGDKVSAEVKKEVEDKLGELKKVKDGDNIDDIKAKTQELSQVIQKIGEAMYKSTPGGQPDSQQKPPEGGGAPKPEEGEYHEKK
ncbi:MAG: Hsp70 family protein, partial [Candidatus Wildermuthbacteria bacterium]|nr:Hsp70 family protein [Candidatus Wildermuthbacteria bacterium]